MGASGAQFDVRWQPRRRLCMQGADQTESLVGTRLCQARNKSPIEPGSERANVAHKTGFALFQHRLQRRQRLRVAGIAHETNGRARGGELRVQPGRGGIHHIHLPGDHALRGGNRPRRHAAVKGREVVHGIVDGVQKGDRSQHAQSELRRFADDQFAAPLGRKGGDPAQHVFPQHRIQRGDAQERLRRNGRHTHHFQPRRGHLSRRGSTATDAAQVTELR